MKDRRWTPEMDAKIEEGRALGMSYREIAAWAGMGLTKNAIAGRVRTLRERGDLPAILARPLRRCVEPRPSTPQTAAKPVKPVKHGCQWIEGEATAGLDAHGETEFCGAPLAGHRWPYCADHLVRVIGKRQDTEFEEPVKEG